MATILDVVNDCLASMGETPLNTLSEQHEFKGSAQRLLTRTSRRVQADGWWCNTESFTASPALATGYVQLPGDVLQWQSGIRTKDSQVRSYVKPWLTQRGNRLYDLRTNSYNITEDSIGEIVRFLPFDQLPVPLAEYIAAETVLKFQSNFDADNSKRQELQQNWQLARIKVQAENTRQLGINLLHSNPSLQRIKSRVRSARRYVGR
jgi:hypothetical protein